MSGTNQIAGCTAGNVTDAPPASDVGWRPRFFVDHGTLHDRKTGTHWREREGYPATEDCEALNAIEALPGGVSERYLRRAYMDDAEFGQQMLREAAERDATKRLALGCGPHGVTNCPYCGKPPVERAKENDDGK